MSESRGDCRGRADVVESLQVTGVSIPDDDVSLLRAKGRRGGLFDPRARKGVIGHFDGAGHFNVDGNVAEREDEERFLFSGLSYLLIQFLKKTHAALVKTSPCT